MTTLARVRRTQADRSADTRARLLQAAVHCLHAHGYAATSTSMVAEEAGVSRGAMLHQFPIKTDLMLFVVRSVFENELAFYKTKLRAISDPLEQVLSMPEIVWEALSRPSGVAVLEILQSSRSDPELAARLAPLQAQIERESFAVAARFHDKLGDVASPTMVRLVHWAIRGLSIAKLLVEDPSEIPKTVKMLRRMMEAIASEPRTASGARGDI